MKKLEKFEPLLTRKSEFSQNLENISKVLELGNSQEKIKILETLDDEVNPEMLKKIILKLDDDEILSVVKMDLKKLLGMIKSGKIQDSKTICAVLTYAAKKKLY